MYTDLPIDETGTETLSSPVETKEVMYPIEEIVTIVPAVALTATSFPGSAVIVFDVDDELVAGSRQNVTNCLRQDNIQHRLEVGHPDGVGGLKLSFVYRDDTAAHDFSHICPCIDGDDKHPGSNNI